MNKIVLKISAVILGIGVTIGVLVFILYGEYTKKSKKYALAQDQYKNLYLEWKNNKIDLDRQIEEIRRKNREEMGKTKAEYDLLMAKQPQMVKDNTKIVTQTKPSNSSGATTVTKQVQVQKPKSKPVTSSS